MAAWTEQSPSQSSRVTPAWATLSTNQSASSFPEDCIILGWNVTIPWDNPKNLVSWETELLVDRLKSGIFIPILYLIGAPTNVVNMAVFFRQGLSKRINMCLFSLALLDLISITAILSFHAERIYTQFVDNERYSSSYRYIVNNSILGLYAFSMGSVLMSGIIATERCVCVLFPFRAQRCIPTKVLATIIVISVLALLSLRFVSNSQYQVTCFYELRTGRHSWQLYVSDFYFRNKAMLNVFDAFSGFAISLGIPIVVLLATVITAIRLHQIVRWRSQASSTVSSAKEIAVTKMLIALSAEFFVLSIPVVIFRLLKVFEPELGAYGRYSNSFSVLLAISELCFYVSSSVNFFVYYFTSAGYRETLRELLGRKILKKIGQRQISVAKTELSVASNATSVSLTEANSEK